ncbi:MAG TPA: aldehyde dehydrogenase family protein [Terriglobia bacterium]|nr:aldehyde dehydrogenase family protein [Terriglobia bacterium]
MDRDLDSIQEARHLVEKAAAAQKVLAGYSQSAIDALVGACAEAARAQAEPLARLAVEETTYGKVEDKVEKNLFCARDVYNAIKGMKTVGVIREDPENGIVEMAVPAGVVAAIIPVTNPTSTAIFKALIALKGRNTIVMSPHPNAVRCILQTARVMAEAAVKAGAPEGSIACLSLPTLEATNELMRHRQTAIILATGGAGLVRAAYSSGKPALGVGPGNVPAYIHSSADVPKAVADILAGKSFDWGTICSSEQHMVVDKAVAEQARLETERQGGFFLTAEQAAAVARVLILPDFRVNGKMVGQSPDRIAQAAGFAVPPGTRALVAPLDGIGRQHPLSAEKLSPVLSFFTVADWREGLDVCRRLLEFGGMGHTMALHARDDQVLRAMALELPAFRLVVNTPAPHGSVGWTTGLSPSMSLGCGTPGGNITSDNISPMHLVNIKRLAYERRPVDHAHAGAAATGREPVNAPALKAPASLLVAPAAPVPNPPAAVIDRAEIARIVDRVLASRAKAAPARQATPSGSCAPAPAKQAQGAASGPSVTLPASAPGGPVQAKPAEFVCEDDVRRALTKGEKIPVGPRTIITPAARDLGEAREIFARRP